MNRTLHIAAKDLLIWSRDPSALGVLLAMPALLIVILGSALGQAMGGGGVHASVAIVNLDTRPGLADRSGDQAAKLEDALVDSERIKALFDIERTRDLSAVRDRVANGELAAALVIPKGFGDHLGSGRAVNLEVLTDPGSGTTAGIWESVVQAVSTRYSSVTIVVRTAVEAVQNANSPLAIQPGGMGAVSGMAASQAAKDDALDMVSVEDTTAAASAEVSSLDYYALSMTAMFLMFGAMTGAFSTIRERREQTMSRMLASPSPGGAVVAGKMLGVFALGATQFAALYVFTKLVLGVEWGAHPLATIAVAVGEIAAVTGLATLISSLATSERGVGGIAPLVVQIQALIGGAFFPITVLPEWLQWVRFLSVTGWTIEGWRKVQIEGLGLEGVVLPVAALLGFALLFFAFGVWRTEARA